MNNVETEDFSATAKVQPTGSDALIEVELEGTGTKRLMMKSVAAFMKKI